MNVKLSEAQKKATVGSPDSIAPIMQQVLMRENKLGRSQEHFWVIGLNNAGKILFIELIALGRQNRVNVNPPDVFRMAIYKLAIKLIMVHNHPSGNLVPSAPDKAITDRIIKVGEIINVEVVDHLIISEQGYFSFADHGIMTELRKSDTWRLIDKEEAEIQAVKRRIEEEKILEQGKKEWSLEMGKKLKDKGMDEATIKQMTGLKLSQIREL